LHKEQFKKFRQPQSKNKINDVDDAIGFHFTRQPEVTTEFIDQTLRILEFRSNYSEEGTGREMENFESLSMIIIDKHFNGKEFVMSEFYFAGDLLTTKKVKGKAQIEKAHIEDEAEQEQSNEIQEILKQQKELAIPLHECGERICIKYIDIYGNEFTEEFKVK